MSTSIKLLSIFILLHLFLRPNIYIFIFLVLLFLTFDYSWSGFLGSQNNNEKINFKLYGIIDNDIIKTKHLTFNVKLNTEICTENLFIFDDIMKKNGINYWLSEGTALGVRRDNSFIEWDDDVDVSFWYTGRNDFIKNVLPELKKNGFTIGGVWNEGNFILLQRKGEKLDIDIVQKDKKCMASATSNTKYNKSCNDLMKYLSGIHPVEFLGRTFNIPGDDYLEYLYSKNWVTPLKSK